MLVNVRDHFNNAFVISSKGQGGLRQLQDYVRRRDLIRTTEKESEEGVVFERTCFYEDL